MGDTNQQKSGENINTPNKSPNLRPPWKPGESGNPAGRPKGSRNFDTIFDEAIIKIVKEKKLPIGNPEVEMVTKAVIEALKGNYSYFRDIMDRRYGKPIQPIDANVKTLNINQLLDDINEGKFPEVE